MTYFENLKACAKALLPVFVGLAVGAGMSAFASLTVYLSERTGIHPLFVFAALAMLVIGVSPFLCAAWKTWVRT